MEDNEFKDNSSKRENEIEETNGYYVIYDLGYTDTFRHIVLCLKSLYTSINLN